MKTDLGRVRGLLTEAITMLCKSSLVYRTEFCIEGLLGITLDNNEVFLVNIKERVKEMGFTIRSADSTGKEPSSTTVDSHSSSASSKRRRLRRSRSGSKSPTSQVEESMDKPREAVGASSDIKQECVDSTKEGGTSVQQMDFGDMLASYEGSVEDTLGEYDDNEQKPMSSEQSGKSTASKTKNDDGEDDDIVIVKEEKADSAAHAEVMQYASEVEQYDYYEQNQDYQDSEQYDPLSGSVKQDYQSLQQLPGSSYEPWSHETGGSPSKTTPRTATKRSLAGNKSSPRSNTKVQNRSSASRKPSVQKQPMGKFSNIAPRSLPKSLLPLSDDADMLVAYACKFCRHAFSCKQQLQQHINGKHRQPMYPCKACGQRFPWRSSLGCHRRKCPQLQLIRQQQQALHVITEQTPPPPAVATSEVTFTHAQFDQPPHSMHP